MTLRTKQPSPVAQPTSVQPLRVLQRGSLPALYLARRLDVFQVLAKAVTGIPLAPRQVFLEPRLRTITPTLSHGLQLPGFGLAVDGRGGDDIGQSFFGKK